MTLNVVDEALYDKISGASSVTDLLGAADEVHNGRPDKKSTLPAVVFQHSAGGDENLTPTRSRDVVYIVKAVGDNGFEEVGEIDDALDALLHQGTLTIDGWTTYWIAREDDIRLDEESDDTGRRFFHSGAFYRIRYTK